MAFEAMSHDTFTNYGLTTWAYIHRCKAKEVREPPPGFLTTFETEEVVYEVRYANGTRALITNEQEAALSTITKNDYIPCWVQ